jgi:predicted phage baseplate assembly protein
MSLRPPPLESRSFDEIVMEARRRIGRYTPELSIGWTDHNDSDPGITLIQLFAWLAQITQERVNQLPDRVYLGLLDLLGMEVRAARPAEADLVFEPIPGVGRAISVPPGTTVGAPPADGAPLTFRTTAPLDLTNCELTHVLTYDGLRFAGVLQLNEPTGEDILPFGQRPESGAALYFGFAPPDAPQRGWKPFPSRIRLRAFEPESSVSPAPVMAGEPPAVQRAQIAWEYLPGPGAEWSPLTIYEDETRALEAGGYLTLEGPQQIEPARLWVIADPHYWLRLRLRSPDYASAPAISFFRFNAVRARQEVSAGRELAGTSTGEPGQKFTLRFRPVVAGSLDLRVEDESGELQRWRRVRYLRPAEPGDPDAGRDAPVYLLDPQTGELEFGDGVRAQIPPPGSDIVAMTYTYGGGEAGNVDADQITALQVTLPGVRGVTNPRGALGGLDAQTPEQAKRAAPQWLRRRDRAVTADDFEQAAREVGGVQRARALPNAHPGYPDLRVPGAVTVLVLQETPRSPPAPSDDLLRLVARELNAQRTLTTEVHVRSPRFIRIDVEAELAVDPDRALGVAQEAARARLRAYLDPRKWRWGQDLYPANLQSQLLELYASAGVWAVPNLRILVDGSEHPSRTEPVRLADDELFLSGRIDVLANPYNEAQS